MKIYLAGKIAGDPNYREKFREAHKRFPATDKILDPSLLPSGLDYEDCLNICIQMIRAADKAAFLPDWRDSPGARLEHEYCRTMGKIIIYL